MSKNEYMEPLLFENRAIILICLDIVGKIALSCSKKYTYIKKKGTEKKELNPIIVKNT